jgi:hexosaminidase
VILAVLAILPQAAHALLPAPTTFRSTSGAFEIKEKTIIVASGKAKPVAEQLRLALRPATGYDLFIEARPKSRSIELRIDDQLSDLGSEGYRLSSGPESLSIVAKEPAGLFYGVQTLRQLLPAKSYSKSVKKGVAWKVPGCEITDKPRFGWRGMHLDESRHFFGSKFVKEYIDWLAMHKMNVFHWHLTDDGGWRIEIKKYPKLTDIGAWREVQGVEWSYQGLKFPGKSNGKAVYGGFYTQDEIKEIVRYAADRFVTVVPEIEMPGHSTEAVAAYPEVLTCTPTPEFLKGYVARWGADHPMMICAGSEKATDFFKDVLTEVMALFPSKFIHIGGDEVPKDLWAECTTCKERIAREGLTDTHALQSSFIKRFDTFLASKGRRLIGWDEILEGGLAPGAAVMSWRGIAGGIEAAKAGHDVVMSPTSHCYFDYPYATTSTKHVYGYEPVPGELSAQEAVRVLGAQANIWTEWLSTEEEVESMMFPRAAALSEAVWTKVEKRDWDQFVRRLATHYERLDHLGISYYVEAPTPKTDLVLLQNAQPVEFERSTIPDAKIRFTVDGSEPKLTSPEYQGAVRLNRPGTIRAATFRPSGTRSDFVSVRVVSILPDARPKIQGIDRKVIEGIFAKCPDPSAFDQVAAKNVLLPVLDEFVGRDNFAAFFEGYLRVPEEGDYTFYLGSDDGSKLWLGDNLVVDNDGLHGFEEKRLRVRLPEGDIPFRIVMFEQGGAESLRFSVVNEQGVKQLVPQSWLWSPMPPR